VEPFDRFLEALRLRGCRVRRLGPNRIRATCPAHKDRRPSLSVSWTGQKVLFNCFTGCSRHNILSALGLGYADLFLGPAPKRAHRSVQVAVYPYVDEAGVLIAEKIRYEPKSFRWRQSDGAGGFRWNLDGLEGSLPLYRLPELAGQRVIIVEGEKAVDRLRLLGFTATCPPAGASGWPERFTADIQRLQVAEVVILPDADGPGQRHAERIAAALHNSNRETGMDSRVRILQLPGLRTSGDVVDWLDSRGSADELETLIRKAPLWFPDRAERERTERKKQLNAERQRRFRERVRTERLAASA
jgi:DNA primase